MPLKRVACEREPVDADEPGNVDNGRSVCSEPFVLTQVLIQAIKCVGKACDRFGGISGAYAVRAKPAPPCDLLFTVGIARAVGLIGRELCFAFRHHFARRKKPHGDDAQLSVKLILKRHECFGLRQFVDAFGHPAALTREAFLDMSEDLVALDMNVTVMDEDTEEEKTWQIVGDYEADVKSGRISISSPIARALIGKEEGDSVEVAAPGGARVFEIAKVVFK